MAGTSRDAKLTLSVEALGQEDIIKLEKSLRDLAAQGGSSAAEFGALADQVDKLGDQNASLQSVKALSQAVQELTDKQRENTATSEAASAKLAEVKTATDTARTAQTAARDALTAGTQAYIEAGNALRTLKSEYDASQRSTDEYRDKLKTLVDQQNKARVDLVGLREENRKTAQAVTEAAQAQRKAEAEYKRTEAQVKRTDAALKEQGQALRDAGEAAAKLGVDVADLAAEEARLQTGFASVARSARERKAAMEEMAEATRLAEIESRSLVELQKRGEAALWAEEAAFRDAEKAVLQYQAAKAKAAADEIAWQKQADDIVSMRIAQEQATASTEQMIRSLRELEAQKAFAKKAEEAQQFVRAADYVRFWENALAEADRKQEELIANTQRLNSAFSTLNIRPIEDVQREIAQTNEAMKTLATSGRLTGGALEVAMTQGAARVSELQREMRQLSGTLTTADKAAALLKNSLGQIAAGNVIADGVGYLVNKVKELGAGFVTVISEQEKLSRALNAVYKDTAVAGRQMDFLRNSAVASGVAVSDLQGSFVKFVASTKAANIPMSVTNDLFLSTARAAGTLGLSGEQVGGMLEALSQMAGKGVVSMEELRQQLADRLPGALSLVAQGLGITEAQLIKLVESGGLAARDLFPALAKSLKTMHGEVEGLNVTWQNFRNVLTGVAQDAGNAGWTQILTGSLKVLGGTLGVVALGLSSVWEGMRLVGVAAVALAATIRGEGAEAWGFFNEQVDISVDRLTEQNDRLSAMLDPTSEAAKRVAALAASEQSLGSAAQGVTAALDKQPQAITTVADSTKYLADVTKILGDANKDASAKIVSLNVMTAERLKKLEDEAVAAGKSAKAVEIQGKALVALTQLRGSEIETLQAQETATENNLAAAERAAEKERALTEVLEQQRQTLVQLAQQESSGLAGRKAEIEAIDQKLVKSRAETEQATAAVAALKEEVATRQLAIQALRDNSARVEEFRKAAVDAQAAVMAYSKALADGIGTQQGLTDLQRQAALAMGLYRDAVSDATARTQALANVEQARMNLQRVGLQVQQQAYQQLAEAARATGNLAQATYYETEAKKVQIRITQLAAEAKLAESKALIAAAEAERAQLASTGQLTEAKKLEIDARILNAKAVAEEARGLRLAADAMDQALRNTDGNTASLNRNTSAISANISERERSIATKEKELELQEREKALQDQLRQGSATMTNEYGSRTGIVNFLKAAGVDDEEVARRIANEFADSNGDIVYSNNPGQLKYGGANSTLTQALLKAAEQYTFGEGRNAAKARGSDTTTGLTTETVTKNGTSKTVTINIGGSSRNVNVASQSDADNLVSVMRELERQSGTAA